MPQHPDPIIRALRHIASPSNKKASNKEKLEATRLLIEYQRELGKLGIVSRKNQKDLNALLGEFELKREIENASGDFDREAVNA